MRTCNTCKIEKSLDEYYADKQCKEGRRSQCKVCKDHQTEKWRERNRDKYNADMRDYNKKHYNTLRLYRYDLSRGDYNAILIAQQNVCAICNKTNPSKKRSLAVDHNPQTGEVRGILCYGCNRALCAFDNTDLLEKIQNYLQNPPARAILLKKESI